MPFLIRPSRRFPVNCSVTYNAGPFLNPAADHDKYKRTIGDEILPDGMNLNQELV
jgi:hypothetical protein